MAGKRLARATMSPADLEQELARIAAMSIDSLRALWRDRRGGPPPSALSKDLLARAIGHDVQKEYLGDLDASTRRLLAGQGRTGAPPTRWLKVGSIIVREHAGAVHEVMVTPEGFCWRGETFTSLSTIALRITGTTWNGARFFGLRGEAKAAIPAGGLSR